MLHLIPLALLGTATAAASQSDASPTLLPTPFGDLEVMLAIDALEAGDEERAIQLLLPATERPQRDAVWADARFVMARAALRSGQHHLALELLDGLDDGLAELGDFVWSYRATAWRQLGDWSQALEAWRQITTTSPQSVLLADAWFGTADALLAQDNWREAKVAYERALTLERNTPRAQGARYNLGRIAESLRDNVRAVTTYRQLALAQPSDPFAVLAMERLQALAEAHGITPLSTRQQLYRVDRLMAAQHHDIAERLVDELAARGAAWLEQALTYRRAQLAYRRGDYAGAIALFNGLISGSAGRTRGEYQAWLARCYSAAGNNDEAIAIYQGLAASHPQRSQRREALFKAAWFAYNGRDHQRALKLFGEFTARYPRDGNADEAVWYMAWNAYRLGDLGTARELLSDLRQRYPRSSLIQRAHYWEGRFADLMGDGAGAAQGYKAAHALDPLSFYAVLAQQRLQSLERDSTPVRFPDGSNEIASAGGLIPSFDSPEDEHALDPSADELPQGEALKPLRQAPMPWGASVFDWQSEQGRRLLRMVRLGLRRAAASLLVQVPTLPGQPDEAVAYGRARMLYSLGDFHAAFRNVTTHFYDKTRTAPGDDNIHYFQLSYPLAHRRVLRDVTTEYGVEPLLILALMRQESAFMTQARSGANANGLMQIIPPTAYRIAEALGVDDFQVQDLTDPAVNIRFGTWYLGALLHKFDGNLVLAVGSYNAGPRAVSQWVDASGGMPLDEFVEEIPYRETRSYVKRVIGNLQVYATLYGGKPPRLPEFVPASYRDNINF